MAATKGNFEEAKISQHKVVPPIVSSTHKHFATGGH